ncbi:hypothetical protein [Caulobacter radicis]|uniref:Uncharacterized protein n=1 Tax=Caulobacter radicis TaxID=2172650 RepID=A0A2T9JN59_9CAUL|nr:hypothetical protein [Caulobacter radicis]PVM85142.1 hypothetical protein DDF65_07520 [Caulobacter radicis]
MASITGVLDWLDGASDAVETAVNHGQEATEAQRIEQWHEEGRQAGVHDAQEDYESGSWRVDPVVQNETPNDLGVAPGSTFDPIELPSFTHPLITAAEVAFTPSELNVGEFAQRDAFQAGHDAGYSTTMFETFDQALDQKLAMQPAEPATPEPSPIDCAIPPLDVSPATDWSTCDTAAAPATTSPDPGYASSGSDGGGYGGDSGGGGGGGGSDSGSSD